MMSSQSRSIGRRTLKQTTEASQAATAQTLDALATLTQAVEVLWSQQEALRQGMEEIDVTLSALRQVVLHTGTEEMRKQFEEALRRTKETKANLRAAREAAVRKMRLADTPEVSNNTQAPIAPGRPPEAFIFGD